jgi:hypothetical protein
MLAGNVRGSVIFHLTQKASEGPNHVGAAGGFRGDSLETGDLSGVSFSLRKPNSLWKGVSDALNLRKRPPVGVLSPTKGGSWRGDERGRSFGLLGVWSGCQGRNQSVA